MINLSRFSSLPIKLNTEINKLIFPHEIKTSPDIRYLKELKPVLYEETSLPDNFEIYYMYRDVCKPRNRAIMTRANLRYDLTVIPSLLIGKEYIKTLGHYHPLVGNSNLTYPEIYEVLNGTAHFLLQKVDTVKVENITLVEAKSGEKIIIPPNYGHVTINPCMETLVMSNMVGRDFSSIYQPIIEMRGAAYYELFINGKIEYVKNARYAHVPPLKREKLVSLKAFNLREDKPIYESFEDDPRVFDFLVHPDRFRWKFE